MMQAWGRLLHSKHMIIICEAHGPSLKTTSIVAQQQPQLPPPLPVLLLLQLFLQESLVQHGCANVSCWGPSLPFAVLQTLCQVLSVLPVYGITLDKP